MAFIGTLGQVSLSSVFQAIEAHAKTGALIVKQGEQWIEFYVRSGRLICIGPVRTNTTLEERLVQAGVISAQALQDAVLALGATPQDETRLALTLMDLGYVSRENLRAWATKEAAAVVQAVLSWQNGEISFEEGQQPPLNRLLVAISISSLLTPFVSPVPASTTGPEFQPRSTGGEAVSSTMRPQVQAPAPAHLPASLSASELVTEIPRFSESLLPESPLPDLSAVEDAATPQSLAYPPLAQPKRVTAPLQPLSVDTSFLRPEMALLPVDLSPLREQNPVFVLTPEQWRLLTRADGRTTLEMACHELGMPVGLIRQVTGELLALGLVNILPSPQTPAPLYELSPVSRQLIASGLANGLVTPGYAAAPAQPWVAIAPTTDGLPPSFSSPTAFETQSQWGNGGNGATFIRGRGWITTPQPLQPLQPSGPLYSTQAVYASAGEKR